MEHREWSLNKWCSVIFSDEASYYLGKTKGNHYVWRQSGFNQSQLPPISNIKSGAMVWGCINYRGIGPLVFIDGTLDSKKYINLIKKNYIPFIEEHREHGPFILQKDNASSHNSSITKKFFEKNNIEYLDWPSKSPDLNPIENL